MDYGLTLIVQFRFVHPPRFVVSDHGEELVDGSDENELGVFEGFSISSLV